MLLRIRLLWKHRISTLQVWMPNLDRVFFYKLLEDWGCWVGRCGQAPRSCRGLAYRLLLQKLVASFRKSSKIYIFPGANYSSPTSTPQHAFLLA